MELFIIIFIIFIIYIILSFCADQFVRKETLLLIKKYFGQTRSGNWLGTDIKYAYLEQLSEDPRINPVDRTISRKLLIIERIHTISFFVLFLVFFVFCFCLLDVNFFIKGIIILTFFLILYVLVYLFNKSKEYEKKKIIQSLVDCSLPTQNTTVDNKTNKKSSKFNKWFLILYILSSIVVLAYSMIVQ